MSIDDIKRAEAQHLGHFDDYCNARTGIGIGRAYDESHGIPTAIDFNYIMGQRKIANALDGMWQSKRKINRLRARR